MSVLAIDPGSQNMGVALMSINYDRAYPYCLDKTWLLSSKSTKNYIRLYDLSSKLEELEKDLPRIDRLIIEEPIVGRNPKAQQPLAYSIGLVLAAFKKRNLPVTFYMPTTIKLQVTGSGRANKTTMGVCIRHLFGHKGHLKSEDVCDAVGIGLTYFKKEHPLIEEEE